MSLVILYEKCIHILVLKPLPGVPDITRLLNMTRHNLLSLPHSSTVVRHT